MFYIPYNNEWALEINFPLGYKVLEKVNSPINGEIVIYSIFGSPRMTIGGLLQSGGVVADIWKKAISRIKNYELRIKNILILGLGGGTGAQIFARGCPEAKIIGVEIDPIVVELGKKYFGLDKIPNLEIVCQDAIKFVTCYMLHVTCYDLILVDLYLGEKIPKGAESLVFLRNLRDLISQNGIVVFNRLFWGRHKKEAEEFVRKAEKIFQNIRLVRTVANLLVICF